MTDVGPYPSAGKRRPVGGEGEPEVFVADEQDAVEVDTRRWAALAEAVLRDEGIATAAELSVLFVDETSIAELNQRFLGTAGPTDVLAFPIDAGDLASWQPHDPSTTGPGPHVEPEDLPMLLGDVVICPTVAAKNAPGHAGTLDDELALLVVHGVLHVLGMDHAEPDERTAMRARELQLLEAHHWRHPAPAGFRQEQDEPC
jgi:probable rRNA maturation factor